MSFLQSRHFKLHNFDHGYFVLKNIESKYNGDEMGRKVSQLSPRRVLLNLEVLTILVTL